MERFVSDPGKPWRDLDWIESARQAWTAEVDALELPWYADEKRQMGAFATFLGFKVRTSLNVWRAIAVGDACLFHVRGNEMQQAFPIARSAAFGNSPDLIGSRRAGLNRVRMARGQWQAGDRFLLMTDALAQWFLAGVEKGRDPLADIRDLLAEASPEVAFAAWVEERRRSSLRNDDVTLLVVDMS